MRIVEIRPKTLICEYEGRRKTLRPLSSRKVKIKMDGGEWVIVDNDMDTILATIRHILHEEDAWNEQRKSENSP